MEAELWGLYSDNGVRHLMIRDEDEESQIVRRFVQLFFHRRDKVFGTPLKRFEREGDSYTFNFYDHELADAFMWMQSASELANFLDGIVREDDFQAHGIVQKVRVFDKFYKIAYNNYCKCDTVWKLFFSGLSEDQVEGLIPKTRFQSRSRYNYRYQSPDTIRDDLGDLVASPQLKYPSYYGRRNALAELKGYLLNKHPSVLVVETWGIGRNGIYPLHNFSLDAIADYLGQFKSSVLTMEGKPTRSWI